ncbi:MAG: TerC/Alx family metal homeostasis membrane protein [Bdellovibrio sp.]|nr:TerC/Alx family metal homeostasis membrane protein [Bdellovibrio sp.]
MAHLFPFSEYWVFYACFVVFILLVLLIDLGLFHKKSHEVSFKEAGIWTCIWVSLALIFNYGLYLYGLNFLPDNPHVAVGIDTKALAGQLALEFLSGYVMEQALSVDNLFVFVVVFKFFGIAAQYQHRVLFFGFLGAIVFRGIFIALGSVLMSYQAVVIFFGAFLIFTGFKMLFAPEKALEPEKNPLIKLVRKFLPVAGSLHGQDFFVRENAILKATPLFVCLLFLEVTDVVFAIDSVPAIFALTKEPLIVFTSNAFAILGLRSMYFMLARIMDKFHYLKYGLAFVLMFVGVKMAWLNEKFEGHFPISISLGIIAGVIFLSILASFIFPKRVVV